jgi:hypothetical protein
VFLVADKLVVERVALSANGHELPSTFLEVAGPAHVVHHKITPRAPAFIAAECSPVDRTSALGASEHREQRRITRRVTLEMHE